MINRGDIYFVDLNSTKGHEQKGRPVLVVSSDAINRQPLVVTVVVGTDAKNVPRDYPVNVRVTAQETGLPHDTVFLCFQIRSLDPTRLVASTSSQMKPAGRMPEVRMADIVTALRLVLEI
jgi:mRNA interferase MazF